MVHVVLGTGLERTGMRELEALTLGDLRDQLLTAEPWLAKIDLEELRCFVRGQEATTLAGDATPVDEEDTVLVTTW